MTKTTLLLYLRKVQSEVFISQLYTFCTLLCVYANAEHLDHIAIRLSSCNIKCTAAPFAGQTLAGHQIMDVKSSDFYARILVVVLFNWETISTHFIWGSLKTLSQWGIYKWKLDAAFCPESKQLSAPLDACFFFSFQFFGTKSQLALFQFLLFSQDLKSKSNSQLPYI